MQAPAANGSREPRPEPKPRRPERTCAACRRKAPAAELLRLVLSPEGDIVLDHRRNLPGRGAHLCANAKCLKSAVSRRSLDRAFGERVRYPEPEALIEAVVASVRRKLGTLLCSGNGARALKLGTDAAMGAVASMEAVCIIIAVDSTSGDAVRNAAVEAGIETRSVVTKDFIGRTLNRRPTGVIAVTDRSLAAAILEAADRLEGLS